MMDLNERLRRVRGSAPSVPGTYERSSRPSEPPLESLVDGHWSSSFGLRCFVVERLYPLDHSHGGHCPSDLLSVPRLDWSEFVSGLDGQPFDFRRAAFLDIETTGLGYGSSTVAFLVGLGFFEEQGFRVCQYFMPDYGDEEALLDLLARDLRERVGLVSFNGRAFDWPIIETRYILSRREAPQPSPPHLDLLHLSRSLWRRMLPSCALGALEASVLGLARESVDVPGYLIPQLYQDYVRQGRTLPMVSVFYHNATDVLSMVALAARIGQILSAPFDLAPAPPCDYASLGRLYERAGHTEGAIRAYQAAMGVGDEQARAVAHKRLSLLLKRLERPDEAMALWQDQLEGNEVYPFVELAKQLEHRLHDYAGARRIVMEAIARVRARDLHTPMPQRLLAELEHRLRRLEKRISRGE